MTEDNSFNSKKRSTNLRTCSGTVRYRRVNVPNPVIVNFGAQKELIFSHFNRYYFTTHIFIVFLGNFR